MNETEGLQAQCSALAWTLAAIIVSLPQHQAALAAVHLKFAIETERGVGLADPDISDELLHVREQVAEGFLAALAARSRVE